MKPDVSGPRAFLVLGPESSGTRLMTQILVNAGCAGAAEHEQPFDDQTYDLYQHDSIAWRRSVPHNHELLDLPGVVSRLHYAGFSTRDIRVIVVVRDFHCTVQSQVRDCQHALSEHVSVSRIREAYRSIFSQVANSGLWFVVVPYESLVLGGDSAQKNLLAYLGLGIGIGLDSQSPVPAPVPIYNGNEKYWRLTDIPSTVDFQSSFVVKASHFRCDWFLDRCLEMGLDPRLYHRKTWECAVIAESIYRRFNGNLTGLSAIGFGVGRDPIASWLASKGVCVLATDFPGNDPSWGPKDHATGLDDVFNPEICPRDRFESLVGFRPVDMRQIPEDLKSGIFDITYSCGSFEHIGGIAAGTKFFVEQMQCLKPGGIAAHTTEFNPDLKSTGHTIDNPDLCLFRECDLSNLRSEVKPRGYEMGPLDLSLGTEPEDVFVDKYPYSTNGPGPHLRLQIGHCVTTSILLTAGTRTAIL